MRFWLEAVFVWLAGKIARSKHADLHRFPITDDAKHGRGLADALHINATDLVDGEPEFLVSLHRFCHRPCFFDAVGLEGHKNEATHFELCFVFTGSLVDGEKGLVQTMPFVALFNADGDDGVTCTVDSLATTLSIQDSTLS